MSANAAADASAKEKPKSKKLLIIVGALVLLLAGAGVGGGLYISKQRAAAEDDEEKPAAAAAHHDSKKAPPTFLPLENMVVNLADPGGDRFVQIGITFEVVDAKTSDQVKAYLPSIRNSILILVSQRTSEELLKREGKEKLASEILVETSKALGFEPEEDEAPTSKSKKKKPKAPPSPVLGVLFSSFIVQ